MNTNQFHKDLKEKMDHLAHEIYKVTRTFPREELYGIISQIRRAALSVVLNYVEGYARIRDKVHKQFLETSYGSLKETTYLIDFSFKEGFMLEQSYSNLTKLSDEIGGMLWGMLKRLNDNQRLS